MCYNDAKRKQKPKLLKLEMGNDNVTTKKILRVIGKIIIVFLVFCIGLISALYLFLWREVDITRDNGVEITAEMAQQNREIMANFEQTNSLVGLDGYIVRGHGNRNLYWSDDATQAPIEVNPDAYQQWYIKHQFLYGEKVVHAKVTGEHEGTLYVWVEEKPLRNIRLFNGKNGG